MGERFQLLLCAEVPPIGCSFYFYNTENQNFSIANMWAMTFTYLHTEQFSNHYHITSFNRLVKLAGRGFILIFIS